MLHAYFPIIFDLGHQEPEAPADEPTALAFLTDQDWKLLVEKSRLVSYQKNEVILKKGARSEAIYIIERGLVRIEREPNTIIARRGPGVVFGEMSFLENTEASASVIADEAVEVSVIDEIRVRALLESVPGFAIRFYKTLAVNLAHRLRQASERLVALS
jgi:CRP-like cAMP-binding protein